MAEKYNDAPEKVNPDAMPDVATGTFACDQINDAIDRVLAEIDDSLRGEAEDRLELALAARIERMVREHAVACLTQVIP